MLKNARRQKVGKGQSERKEICKGETDKEETGQAKGAKDCQENRKEDNNQEGPQ